MVEELWYTDCELCPRLQEEFVTKLGMSKGLCIRLLCVRVGLCCTLGRVTQFFPQLVKKCICVSFMKVMTGVHVTFYVLQVNQNSWLFCMEANFVWNTWLEQVVEGVSSKREKISKFWLTAALCAR